MGLLNVTKKHAADAKTKTKNKVKDKAAATIADGGFRVTVSAKSGANGGYKKANAGNKRAGGFYADGKGGAKSFSDGSFADCGEGADDFFFGKSDGKRDDKDRAEREKKLVCEIIEDFKERREARRAIELNWRLNMNFAVGNQFARITPYGNIEEDGKRYFWQQREVYNHIAPILETRLSKLARVKAQATVRPATGDDRDVASAALATKLIAAVSKENSFYELLQQANSWSEITGTCFYKTVWDGSAGCAVDAQGKVKEGDVRISVCPPFEIFPENIAVADVDGQPSIMHARVLGADEVEKLWGKRVKGEELDVFSFENAPAAGGFGYGATAPSVSSKKEDGVLVIEKYEAPSVRFPRGRLIIVGGEELLYIGDMPYLVGEDGEIGYPFSRQVCIENLGCFFGTSIVTRIIPVQRAYNAVKNRKHEYMNRLAAGVLAVEDGSVDTDGLEEEGLYPGKVLVYRQGSVPPAMMSAGQVPSEFAREEEKLLSEFVMISGVSEVTTYSQVPANVASGVAISLLLEQDDTRISLTADYLRDAVKRIGKHILRLYKQFVGEVRLKRVTGDNGDVEIAAFSREDFGSEDVVFDTVNEIEDTLSARRAMVYDLLKLGLFNESDGKLSNRTKVRLLDILGFGNWEAARDADEAHLNKAARENMELVNGEVAPDVVDNHAIHIEEHTRLCVSKECGKDKKLHERVLRHIAGHREFSTLDEGVKRLTAEFDGEGGYGKETE